MNHESPVYKDIQKSNNSVTFSTAAVRRGNFPLWPSNSSICIDTEIQSLGVPSPLCILELSRQIHIECQSKYNYVYVIYKVFVHTPTPCILHKHSCVLTDILYEFVYLVQRFGMWWEDLHSNVSYYSKNKQGDIEYKLPLSSVVHVVLCIVYKFSSYLTENTLCPPYKDQSVNSVQGDNRCLL